jgi:hypothetical protein
MPVGRPQLLAVVDRRGLGHSCHVGHGTIYAFTFLAAAS